MKPFTYSNLLSIGLMLAACGSHSDDPARTLDGHYHGEGQATLAGASLRTDVRLELSHVGNQITGRWQDQLSGQDAAILSALSGATGEIQGLSLNLDHGDCQGLLTGEATKGGSSLSVHFQGHTTCGEIDCRATLVKTD